jgi:hypothetical protein
MRHSKVDLLLFSFPFLKEKYDYDLVIAVERMIKIPLYIHCVIHLLRELKNFNLNM